jgi:predicted membrane protein
VRTGSQVPPTSDSAGIAMLPLGLALTITVVATAWPPLLMVGGKADHLAANLLFWSMSAGFVRGVGFVPKHQWARWLWSSTSCYGALVLFALRLFSAA